MADVISTTVLVNGRYVERAVDMETVLQMNGVGDRKDSKDGPLADPAPSFGLLTQTVVQSPLYHWILPARLGNIEDNDVAFIGDNCVKIKRLNKSGRLFEVGQIGNFGSRIRNARVIGSISLDVPSNSASDGSCSDVELPGDDESEHFGKNKEPSNSSHDYEMSVDEDSRMSEQRQEVLIDDMTENMETTQEFADLSMQDFSSKSGPQLGPHKIVLALECGELIFIFATDSGPDQSILPLTSRHAPTKTMLEDQPGTHLAVDPSSRYMAIASSQDVFAIYSLRPNEQATTQYQNKTPVQYVEEERHFHLKGVILKMEFLFPSPSDPDHIILLLLIARRGLTRMQAFEWVAGQPLIAIRSLHKKGYILDPMYRMPLLLIPSTLKSAFLLVCENAIVVCEGLLEGEPRCRPSHIPTEPPGPFHKGLRPPIWTSWTRPVRHRNYAKTHDDIYIAREDGLVKYLESNLDEFLCPEMTVGGITSNIGTAFASLDATFSGKGGETFPGQSSNSGEILVVGGDSGTNGGLYWVQARKDPELLMPIPNWAPMVEFDDIFPCWGRLKRDYPRFCSSNRQKPNRLAVCTKRALVDLRRGLLADLWMPIELDYLEGPITTSWILPQDPKTPPVGNKIPSALSLFLVTTATESSLLQFEENANGVVGVSEVNSTWLKLDCPTIAAAYENGYIVQITNCSIRISAYSPLTELGNSDPAIFHWDGLNDNQIIVEAALYRNSLAAVVVQNQDGDLHLYLLQITAQTQPGRTSVPERRILNVQPIGEPFPLDGYPTSISLEELAPTRLFLVVGCTSHMNPNVNEGNDKLQSTVKLYQIIHDDGLLGMVKDEVSWSFAEQDPEGKPEVEKAILSSLNDIPDSCVSTLFLADDASYDRASCLLAGHRNGTLVLVKYSLSADGIFHQLMARSLSIGDTDVIVSKDPVNPNAALICCDSKLYRVVFDSSSYSFPPIHRVWFRGEKMPLDKQPYVDSVTLFDGRLLIASGQQLLGVEMACEVVEIPTHATVEDSPSRILFATQNGINILATSDHSGRPNLKFFSLDPEDQIDRPPIPFSGAESLLGNLGEKGEKILSMAEWTVPDPVDVSGTRKFLIVGTNRGHLIPLENDHHLRYVPVFSTNIDEDYTPLPVYAIAADRGATNLFCGIGNTLRVFFYDMETGAIDSIAQYSLPSHAVAISPNEDLITVLTARDSAITLHFDKQRNKFAPQYVDQIPRSGLDLMELNIKPCNSSNDKPTEIILMSDKDCSVVGLRLKQRHHGKRIPEEYDSLFEAELPVCITRFRLTKTRPLWDMVYRDGPGIKGVIPWNESNEDLLGGAIDGSFRNFTLLEEPLWRLLRVLQDMAKLSESAQADADLEAGDITRAKEKSDTFSKHIDGDLLQKWAKPGELRQYLFKGLGKVLPGDFEPGSWKYRVLQAAYDYWDDFGWPQDDEMALGHTLSRLVVELLEMLLRPVL